MRSLSALILAALLFPAAAQGSPVGSGGGSSGSADGASFEGWLAIGAAVGVAGILIWDAINDSQTPEAESSAADSTIEDTGVNWAGLEAARQETIALGVAIFPGDNGLALARYFLRLLLPLEESGCSFAGDPLNLGPMTPREQAVMAEDFLGYSWFVASDATALYLFSDGDAPSWSAGITTWDSLSVRNAAASLLEAAPSLR